ncbi:ribose/galactose ABC transporter substrate-binding protein [Spiroplasma clarkii]|uniref:Basic membrane protein A n=1 Tax=Spiroplasma clarkii TaxID=2139 RepID=A0A1Y0L2N8_9MOLU|nr:hypothetical protein [Spiroplasma clarkii]ARU92281.1 ribose/galactose ABC transporter substrate-binding protein [Spiroplasma clarkii]ATX71591.1 basic membrane protein A [Spiroplasma clarkii]
MKKLLSALMATTIVASSSASVIACGSNDRFNEIWLITDAGKINDKSFNESSFNGGNKFLDDFIGNKDDKGEKIYSSIAYSEPRDLTALESAYNNAAKKGAKTLILPGFHHSFDGKNKAPDIMKTVGGSTIILDNGHAEKENQVGIQFRGDISGFFGGLSSIVWYANKNQAEANPTVKLGTYGGQSFPGSVDNFMVGYLAAAEYWNKLDDTKQAALAQITQGYKRVKADFANESAVIGNNAWTTTSESSSWFTSSFDAGKGATISNDLINRGANVIMPVAGPQTYDTLVAAASPVHSAKNVKVVGVDTDQVEAYSDYSDRFITSAKKDLVGATILALGHVSQYKDNSEIQDAVEEYWNKENIVLTRDDVAVNPATEKGKSWENQTLFAGGAMGTNEKNLIVKDGLYTKLWEFITDNEGGSSVLSRLTVASKELFTAMGKLPEDPQAKATIIGGENIVKYANAVLGTE